MVNENYMNSTTLLEDPCASFTGMATLGGGTTVRVHPNPFDRSTTIIFPVLPGGGPATLVLMDLQGRELRRYDRVTNGRVLIDRGDLAAGAYVYRITGPMDASGRLLVE